MINAQLNVRGAQQSHSSAESDRKRLQSFDSYLVTVLLWLIHWAEWNPHLRFSFGLTIEEAFSPSQWHHFTIKLIFAFEAVLRSCIIIKYKTTTISQSYLYSLISLSNNLQVESVHRSMISHTGYKVTTYSRHVHKRVAMGVAVRNDGLALAVTNFHETLRIGKINKRSLKRLGKIYFQMTSVFLDQLCFT